MRTITKQFIDTPIGEVELEHFPCEWVDPIIEVAPNGNVIVGYLVHDSDCQNPLEDCDGMGEIHHHPRSRYGSRDSNYYDILGLDSYGEPRLDEDKLQNLWREAAMAVPLDVFTLPDLDAVQLRKQFVEEDVEDVTIGCHATYAWKHNTRQGDIELEYDQIALLVERIEDALDCNYASAVAKARIEGDPDAILLDLYDHSGVAYSVSGGGMQCRWDTSTGESVWIPDACVRQELKEIAEPTERYRKAKEYAAQACETYTSWCNGDCYGVVVQTHDSEGALLDDDACWGYIGSEWAEKELTEQVALRVKHNDKEAA